MALRMLLFLPQQDIRKNDGIDALARKVLHGELVGFAFERLRTAGTDHGERHRGQDRIHVPGDRNDQ